MASSTKTHNIEHSTTHKDKKMNTHTE